MTKRLLSLLCTLVVTLGVMFLANVKTSAAYNYDARAALSYAQANWNSGVGLCAEYVAKCLRAGGVDVSNLRVCTLYDEILDKGYGTSYKLTLTGGRSGRIRLSDNVGKLEAGDPIFFYCNSCKGFQHVVLCNGANSEGYSQDYAHNNAHDGYRTTYTYTHSCGHDNWTFYSIRMFTKDSLFGTQTGVSAPRIKSLVNTNDGIKIEWNKVDDAKTYRVYRQETGGKRVLIKKVKENVFVDTKAKAGKEYIYTVRADNGKKLSPYYAGEEVVRLEAVEFKEIKNTKVGISLSWEQNTDGEGYRIYRKVNNGKWTLYKSIKSNETVSFVDANVKSNNTYNYRIRAISGLSLGSCNFTGVNSQFLSAPNLENARNAVKGIAFNWDSIKGAKEYRVFRKADNEKTWKRIAVVKENCYVDSNVESGVCYRYTVKAVNKNVMSGYDSKGVLLKCLSTPQIIDFDVTQKGISLVWNEIEGSKGYYVYRKTNSKYSWKKIADVKNGTSYTDSTVKKDKAYLYSVRAYDDNYIGAYAKSTRVKNQTTK